MKSLSLAVPELSIERVLARSDTGDGPLERSRSVGQWVSRSCDPHAHTRTRTHARAHTRRTHTRVLERSRSVGQWVWVAGQWVSGCGCVDVGQWVSGSVGVWVWVWVSGSVGQWVSGCRGAATRTRTHAKTGVREDWRPTRLASDKTVKSTTHARAHTHTHSASRSGSVARLGRQPTRLRSSSAVSGEDSAAPEPLSFRGLGEPEDRDAEEGEPPQGLSYEGAWGTACVCVCVCVCVVPDFLASELSELFCDAKV
jgi:hypothetical protein